MDHEINLDSFVRTEIMPSAPFSFDGTLHKPSHFPTPDNAYCDGHYWQTLFYEDHPYGLEFINAGTTDAPRITLMIYFHSATEKTPDVQALVDEIKYRFDLDSSTREFTSRYAEDTILGPAMKRWRGMRISTAYSLYEFTVVTTVLQNTVVRRTVQMMQNLFHNYGTLVSFADKKLYCFWNPRTIDHTDEMELRALKVGYRAKTLKRQAAFFVSNSVDLASWRQLDRETLRDNLLRIYGIGPATVQYALCELFHHYDIIEHIPPWEQKIYSHLLFDKDQVDTDVILDDIDRRYGKWKMLAVHYIFEDLFWLRKNESVPWLEALIRL